MTTNIVRVALELLEVEQAVVVEPQWPTALIFGEIIKDGVDIGLPLGHQLCMTLKNSLLAYCKHGIEATQHCQRQHHTLELWRTIRATKKIGYRPNEIR